MANWDGTKQQKRFFKVTQTVDMSITATFCVEANDMDAASKKVSAFLGVEAKNHPGINIFPTRTLTEYMLSHGKIVEL